MAAFMLLTTAMLYVVSVLGEVITVTSEPSASWHRQREGSAAAAHITATGSHRSLLNTFPLTPFWSSTGLCPPEPRNSSGLFLLSRDNLLNLEIIAALTDRGVHHVRVHWLLELLDVTPAEKRDDGQAYNFTELDRFLDKLKYFGLQPAFELMGVPSHGTPQSALSGRFWIDLVQQLVDHYVVRYGLRYVAGWRFESWNEPDLRNYNMLNFTIDGYLAYVDAVRHGLDAAAAKAIDASGNGKHFGKKSRFDLLGPAGLFKAEAHHPFCWGILERCNNALPHNRCPFDMITFHRKGSGRWASEVVDGGRQLAQDILARFPNVRGLPFANDEADPIASWSTGRPFQADVRYAAMLFSIVVQHWDAMTNGSDQLGRHFAFLSHDNAFLAYHPYEFDQRTLLARFQMNNTEPAHVQFVAKPVYSALGMLAKLGTRATRTQYREGNVSYIVSFDDQSPPTYLCMLAARSNDSSPLSVKRTRLNVTVPLHTFLDSAAPLGTRVSYLIEGIQDGINDPYRLWKWQGRPAYPSTSQLAAMRAIQLPTVLNEDGAADTVWIGAGNRTAADLSLSFRLRGPWIVSVRVCSKPAMLSRVRRVRVRQVFQDDVLIFWTVPKSGNLWCIQTYEVWFKPQSTVAGGECQWRQLNRHLHTPFTFFQYVADRAGTFNETDCSGGVHGYYRVRAIDMFQHPAPYSAVIRYVANGGD